MAARIIGVTFETTTQGRAGAFSVPRAAADLLGIHSDDRVELRIVWEGQKLELATSVRSGLEIYPRSTDVTTAGLNSIPASTPITVTVWRGGETLDDDSSGEALWTDERFDQTFVAAGGPADLIRRLRLWATEREIALRYGSGKTAGPLHFDIPATDPRIQLISVGATGGIEWVFRGNLDRARGFSGAGVRREFFRRIGDLFGTDRSEGSADTWFGVPAERLSQDRYGDFLAMLDEMLELVRSGPSDLRQQYQRFFTRVLKRFHELRPGVTNTQSVGPQNWLEFSAGRSGVRFSWATAHRKYMRCELYIDVGRQAENKRIFDRLRERADELEEALGQTISWERLDERRASRLAVYGKTPDDSFDSDEALSEWAAQTMAKLVDVMRPLIRAL